MSTDINKPNGLLIHVHTCIHCGSASRREEFEDVAQTSGIYRCSKCDKEGPLNIEIRTIDSLEVNSDTN